MARTARGSAGAGPPDRGPSPSEASGDPLGFLLAAVGRQAMAAFAARLEPFGLHPRAYAVLWAVGRGAAPSQRELAGALGLPASRVVGLLDALEVDRLVARVADDADRRTHRVHLTTRGRRLLRRVTAQAGELDSSLVADLDEVELAALRAALAKVSARLADAGAPATRLW